MGDYGKWAKIAIDGHARIAQLEAKLVEAQTLDKGFYEWLIERDLLARGEEVEWPDIVTALTEHEIEVGAHSDAKLATAVGALEFARDEAGRGLAVRPGDAWLVLIQERAERDLASIQERT